MFSFCVDKVSRMEYKPEVEDCECGRLRKASGEAKEEAKGKKISSPAALGGNTHHGRMGGDTERHAKTTTHFFGRTKKVSAPPTAQFEALLAAASHLRDTERQRKKSAIDPTHSTTGQHHHPHRTEQHQHQTKTTAHRHADAPPNGLRPFRRLPEARITVAEEEPKPSREGRRVGRSELAEGRKCLSCGGGKASSAAPSSEAEALSARLDAALAAVEEKRRRDAAKKQKKISTCSLKGEALAAMMNSELEESAHRREKMKEKEAVLKGRATEEEKKTMVMGRG